MNRPFRALTLRFNCPVGHGVLRALVQEFPFEFCASLASIHCALPMLSEDAQPRFHSVDARQGVYPGAGLSALQPLDEEIITELRDCEALFMFMMTRHEHARIVPYSRRKELYLTHLRFWNDFLERHDINILISSELPHEMPDHVIYALCKWKKIPIVFAHAAPIKDTFFLQSDIEESVVQIRDRLAEIHAENPDDVLLSPQLEQYYKTQTQLEGTLSVIYPKKPTTIFQKFAQQILSMPRRRMHWLPTLFSMKDWTRRAQKLRTTYLQRSLCRFYDTHAVKPDLDKPFVYFPLQYQPECSTCPMAGAFNDQELSIHLLSRTLPAGVLLYVKEHPRQRTEGTAARSIWFYQQLLAMPNVRLVAHDTSTFHLREHCTAVATGTGTAGLEALFRQKPVFLFGHTFFQYAEGVFMIRTRDDCAQAVDAVFAKGARPTLKGVRRFLKAIDDTRIHGSVGDWYLEISDRTVEESTNAFNNALRRWLQKL